MGDSQLNLFRIRRGEVYMRETGEKLLDGTRVRHILAVRYNRLSRTPYGRLWLALTE